MLGVLEGFFDRKREVPINTSFIHKHKHVRQTQAKGQRHGKAGARAIKAKKCTNKKCEECACRFVPSLSSSKNSSTDRYSRRKKTSRTTPMDEAGMAMSLYSQNIYVIFFLFASLDNTTNTCVHTDTDPIIKNKKSSIITEFHQQPHPLLRSKTWRRTVWCWGNAWSLPICHLWGKCSHIIR